MLNILTEPLICITTASGKRMAALPEMYALLMADAIEGFPALRPHQKHPQLAFWVQLAAMAMYRAGISEPPENAAEWARLLCGLTPDWPNGEPWQLVVEDITKPAFMQPPARSADRLADYKSLVTTPDELDMLVTAKNHDLKASIALHGDADDWIFALVSLQTMEGYGGARNYGISRMPSGYGNRPAFTFTPSIRPGRHVKRDVAALLEHRNGILADYPVSDNGIGLLWLEPWDGTKAETLLLDRMDPFYIEVCRRVRLRKSGGRIEAVRANSLDRRIADVKGQTGDPWAPQGKSASRRETPPAFLNGSRKFGYERIVDGLFSPDWTEARLMRMTEYDRTSGGTVHLVARGVVRGEGGTEGYHERIIPLRPKTIQVFGRTGGPKELEDIARERIADIRNTQRILRRAVATFAAHGDSQPSAHRNGKPSPNDIASPWVNRLDEIVDERFFDDLQTEFEETQDAERRKIRELWLADFVIANANAILDASRQSIPCPDGQSLRAFAASQNVFNGRIYQEFNVSLD